MADAGMALETVWRKTVHQPRLTVLWRRNSLSSTYGQHVNNLLASNALDSRCGRQKPTHVACL